MDKFAALSVEFTPTVAQDPSTEPFSLELIALYGDVELRQAVASNPNTPSKILFGLADEFPGEFFNNPVFPLLTLENPDFYKSLPNDTLRNLLANESVPDGWQQWASTQTNNWSLYESLIANPVTSHATLTKLASKGGYIDELARMHVNYAGEMTSGWHEFFKDKFKPWKNQSYPDREKMLLLWELGIIRESQFMQLPIKLKRIIIKSTNSLQLIETVLANKPSKRLRLECARNFFTSAHHIVELAYDNNKEVREGAMCNPNIPREVVEEYYRQHMTANHPNSQSHELSKLISSKWWFIRVNAAKHPNLSLDDLKLFLADSDLKVRASAASNPNIPIELLDKLSSNKSALIRLGVAKNIKAPIQCLEKLSCDHNEEVRAAVAFNPNISRKLSASIKAELIPNSLKKYSKDIFSKQDEYNAAVNPTTSLTELITIYKQNQNSYGDTYDETVKNICQQLICNQDISSQLIFELLTNLFSSSKYIEFIDRNIYTVLAHHKNANDEICQQLIKYSNLKLRCSLAQNPNLSIESLEKLLQDTNADIRWSALQAYQKRYANSENKSSFLIEWETATYPDTPPEKLAELFMSKWVPVREAVAMHPHAAEAFIPTKGKKAPLTVLDKLAKDTRQAVKIAVANNPKTSIETLEAIIRADKYHSKTSLAALKHLLLRAPDRAEKHLLHYYQQMGDFELSNFILEHPAAPIDLLKKKLRLLSWMERYTITQNSKSSRAILEILTKDGNRVVRAAAKERLATDSVTDVTDG